MSKQFGYWSIRIDLACLRRNSMFHFLIFLSYTFLCLILIVAGYQCLRMSNTYRVIGFIAMLIITILYTIGLIFFPHSLFMLPLTSLALAPAGLLFVIYYLAFSERRNRAITIIAVIFLVFFVVVYLVAIIDP